MEEHRGPITNWQEFAAYPWPDPAQAATRSLEWYEENLPDDMCVIVCGHLAHFLAYAMFLMGFETFCYALYDQRDLVQAIVQRLTDIFRVSLERMLRFERVKIVFGKDDMGYRAGTMIRPADLRAMFLPGHRLMATMSHEAGRPYLLHTDGDVGAIMDDLIADVGIDGKHAFEDTVEDVVDVKAQYGHRVALLGGIDVDFLTRADEAQIRRRVRHTLEKCMPGGGYCLGSGNSVTNYVPLRNYLTMLDEGRRFRP
jgi:uroporphyrinogen decarboxylase